MRTIQSARLILGALIILMVAACGGGGSSDSTSANGSGEQISIADLSELDTNTETQDFGELPAIFQPPPAPGAIDTTPSFDGLWDASDVEQSATRYWLISSDDGTWTTYLLDPNTNTENCYVTSTAQFTEEGIGFVRFAEAQPETITDQDGVIGISVSSGALNLSYQDSSSTTITSIHRAVTAITAQDLQRCD